MEENRIYAAIDLKSFYASVECMDRGLDPLTTNLVVADPTRTEKTICLAVSPALKAWGIPGRPRLFEVVEQVKQVNTRRSERCTRGQFTGKSCNADELRQDPSLALDYIVAPPRMAHYMAVSTQVYDIYLRYIAPEDIHIYSVDEVFVDLTDYLNTYRLNPRDLTMKLIREVLSETGITATAGIGTNLYLAKVAMDIVAKKAAPDKNGVRMAELNERSYREKMWSHRPLTDFWRVGRGLARRLEAEGLYTMGDIARCSLGDEDDYYNEELLYKMFGVNAELLIDHAWGWENCTMADIKAYKPENNSICSGQVLQCPYSFDKGRIVIREMADMLTLDLVEKGLVTDQLVLTAGYDVESLYGDSKYSGEVTTDYYGRRIPKHAHGTANLDGYSSSTKAITDAVLALYDRIVDKNLLLRRFYLTANRVIREEEARENTSGQMDLFAELDNDYEDRKLTLQRERNMQQAVLKIKKKYGKNAILKGTNFEDGATMRDRNAQIGGHKA